MFFKGTNIDNLKTFVVINLAWIGDTLLTSVLCQDIKLHYPESKLIFIVSKPFYDIAAGIPGVDEVYAYDKSAEHKGIPGIFKFAKDFKYRNNVDCAFISHTHERSLLLSLAIGSKIRVSAPIKFKLLNLLITHQYKYSEEHIRNTYKADFNANYLKLLTGKPPQSKMKFQYPDKYKEEIKDKLKDYGYENYELIGVNPCSKDSSKDWEPKEVAEFINLMNATGKRVVITGTGRCCDFAKEVKTYTEQEFLDFTNKTTIFQLAALIGQCRAYVSVDTGPMHISYSIGTPTVCLFYDQQMIKEWGPQDRENNLILYQQEKFIGKYCYEKTIKLIENLYNKQEPHVSPAEFCKK